MGNAIANLRVTPLGDTLGAQVHGVDLSEPMDAALRDALVDAWLRHIVLLFRGQSLSPAEQIDAARIFGEPQAPAAAKFYEAQGQKQNDVDRHIMVISNLGPDGLPALQNDGLGSGEVQWHSDNSYVASPPAGSLLYSLEIPPQGGDTFFCNQYAAYETLSDTMKARIGPLKARHDASRNSAGVLRPGLIAPETPEDVPGPDHPLVRIHPQTGRPALYLGRRRDYPSQFIIDMPMAESEALLDELWAHATAPRFVWRHQWQLGDAVLWDNRAAMHYREPHDPSHRRIMHRVQIAGDAVRGSSA
ncbi:MAG: TauD/TfdA family dioxygenase [Gammaproteobacteria bacterium]|nr:TauD/TfdA family dioxygenase [Gammaproteobacteria bacterium]